jgi:hypothetical protein
MAALLAVAFFAGLFMRTRPAVQPAGVDQAETSITSEASGDAGDRLLVSVVSDHLDTSGRVLLEVANATTDQPPVTSASRADDLVNANRIYRQTAQQRGDERIVQLLSELEPILLELANADGSLQGKKLAELQKRIESKGLLFKVRVMSTPAETLPKPDDITDSL